MKGADDPHDGAREVAGARNLITIHPHYHLLRLLASSHLHSPPHLPHYS